MFLYKILLAGILTASMSAGRHPEAIVKWVVQQNSTLQVQGSSNVNHFSCSVKSLGACDTLHLTANTGNTVSLTGCIRMDVWSFNCQNSFIQKDLRKTLKAEEYPKMTIRFISLKKMPTPGRLPENISGWVEVELAGTKKAMEINYTFLTNTAGQFQLNGERKFSFSDFSLEPPRKLAGLVKIRDEFNVVFQLNLKRV